MISIYGKSINNLASRLYVDQSHICAEIGKCFESEKSALAYARLTGKPEHKPLFLPCIKLYLFSCSLKSSRLSRCDVS